jgi:hypothetical protein
MKKYLTMALVGVVMLGASSAAYANVCAFDNVPSATLLFPFVAYNYTEEAEGPNTFFSVTNTSSEATIAHVTLWTDFSLPILDFNILLTGYDVQVLNIRDILQGGDLPVTVLAGHTTDEGIIDQGPVSENNPISPYDLVNPDTPEPTLVLAQAGRCDDDDLGYPGDYGEGVIDNNTLGYFEGLLKASQTLPRFYSNCDGGQYDNPGLPSTFLDRTEDDDSWMYITVDVVDDCNLFFPDEVEYWSGDRVRFDNVLIGDVQWVNNTDRFSEASNAVHLEANVNLDFITTETVPLRGASFYHRYNFLADLRDYREPLPSAWAFRYTNSEDLGLATYIRAFKASTLSAEGLLDLEFGDGDLFNAPTEMTALNCLAYTYYAWDEDENVTTTELPPWSGGPGNERAFLNLLPLETQEIPVADFQLDFDNGWMLFVWPPSNVLPDAPYTDWWQTWMGVKFVLEGSYSAFMEGAVMANYACFEDQVLPNLGWNDSGQFE